MRLAKQPKYVGAVIGAGFGDEGKGLTTDYLVREQGKGTKLVIRYNGGPQAGHTVETDDGKRHVFSHFGSGTFAGANTYFSKFCSVNPLLFNKEYDKLKSLVGTLPLQLASYLCQVTTPWDMIMNQNVEKQRTLKPHGSTGMGIGVTEDRRLKDLETPLGYISRLSRSGMRQEFTTIRDMIYGVNAAKVHDFMGWKLCRGKLSASDILAFTQKRYMESFLDHFELMLDRVGVVFDGSHIFDYDTIVFEGAQGLLLDERYAGNDHVTWSNTGMVNITQLCNGMGIGLDEVLYVTRCYGSRHGAGPEYLDRSICGSFKIPVTDETNVYNPWQEHIRFFPLDERVVVEKANLDSQYGDSHLYSVAAGKPFKSGMMVTWAHLLDNPAFNSRNNPYGFESSGISKDEWLDSIGATHLAYGKTASSVITRG